MRSRITAVVLVLLGFACFFPGCGSDDTTGPGSEVLRLAEGLFIIPDLDSVEVAGVVDSTYVLTYSGDAPEIATGDFIAGLEGGGFLRRVSSVVSRADTLTVETAWAALTDAVISGRSDTTFEIEYETLLLQPSGPETASGPTARYLAPGVSVTARGLDFSGTTLYSGKVGGADLSVILEDGWVDFTPLIDLYIAVADRQIEEFRAAASGRIEFTCEAAIEATAGLEHSSETLLASFEFTEVQYFGSLPVVEVVTLSYWGGFDLDLSGRAICSIGCEGDVDVEVGARYRKGAWSDIWSADGDFYEGPFEWAGYSDIAGKVYVKPRVDVAFYGAPGPMVSADSYARTTCETGAKASADWDLMGGVAGQVDYRTGILDYDISSYEASLACYEACVDSGSLADWSIVYSEDFSADPGWDTNFESRFYWNETEETYHADIWTADETNPLDPETYAVIELPYETGSSFKLEFKARMDRSDYASGLNFGVFDADLCFHDSPNTINIEFTNPQEGRGFVLWAYNCDKTNKPAYDFQFVGFDLGEWYHVEMVYEHGDARAWVTDSGGGLVSAMSVPGMGSFCPGSTLYLGISRKCVRYEVQLAICEIDNVRLYTRDE